MNSSVHFNTNPRDNHPSPIQIQNVFTAGDAAKHVMASVTTVKRLATELRLDIMQTESGVWLFTEDQVEKIKKERVRRQMEATRNAGGRR